MQAAIGLSLGLPGHLSTDSIVQLYEGRTLQRLSFNPPLMSVLLGALDRLGDAPAAFVLLSQAMLTASTWLVLETARHGGWRLALAAPLLLNPVVLIHVGIVWKDVLLGHAAVLLFLLIARAWRTPASAGRAWSALVLLLATVVVGARQQGLLFALPAAAWAAAALVRGREARRNAQLQGPGAGPAALHARPAVGARRVHGFVLALAAFTLLPLAANRLAAGLLQQTGPQAIDSASVGWRVLAQFDLVGILAQGGRLPEGALPPAVADTLRAQVGRYTPYRVDTLETTPGYWGVPNAEVARAWADAIRLDSLAYARHRLAHFQTLLGLADRQACLPFYTGIAGPVHIEGVREDLTGLLGLRSGPYPQSPRIRAIVDATLDTPFYQHAFHAAAAIVLAALLALRREFVLATLALCSLALLGSYLLIGIACDFRYAYTLTVATSLLAAQWLLAPRGPAGMRAGPQARPAAGPAAGARTVAHAAPPPDARPPA